MYIRAKRQLLEAILEHMEAMHEEVWSVATSPRRDVPTSRRWVNQYNSQQVATSRRGNVATSARDLPSMIKSSKGFRIGGIGRRMNEGTEFQSSSDTDFEEVPVICIASHFWILK